MPVQSVNEQLERIVATFGLGGTVNVQLERPRNPDHGDLSTNLALILAKRVGEKPQVLAQAIIDKLDLSAAGLRGAEIAGPGFINFRFAHGSLQSKLLKILQDDTRYGSSTAEPRQRIQIEFVSANPTGPLHVAHGRGAALGDGMARLLEATGHDVQREFYVNDAGVQMHLLGASLEARWREVRGEDAAIPEGGYHGAYIRDLAERANGEHGEQLARMPDSDRVAWLRDWGSSMLRAQQEADLAEFRVRFDDFYSETSLYVEKKVEETLNVLRERGQTYEAEGATWLRTTAYGDDKDRVIVKSDGTYTYFLPDLAYHRDKARRGFEHVIDIWGADHHGYAPRMKAGLAALGYQDFLDTEIVQMVRIMRAGSEMKMSKRSGEFITLRDLFEETGVDVARYFFLMRRSDAQMLFDLDLALDHSEKNPVYKVQYAHARMHSIFRKAGREPGVQAPTAGQLSALEHESELELIKQLAIFPDVVARAADARAPHIVCEYLETTAGMVNSWYHAGNPSRNPQLAVLVADETLRAARLALANTVRIVLRNGLTLLGLGAPERMDRESEESA
ncbi:MAG TPA: arginine--tRNA ligase [Longimicrobiales bacterium]|nr:arginine--tRNA ligase [Longimicrobiales bacterium]